MKCTVHELASAWSWLVGVGWFVGESAGWAVIDRTKPETDKSTIDTLD